ncbi:TM2 domain-containing protein [Pontibacter beigongshangensis]|uniref:TM2 domain-containing protein n=1 Tax=Pontibacter beigongshangensis TaxID=2574733 RepID=UPI001888643D|nr:TM2 domain-containing protein [Pontibacter beigongshangensis]
MNILNLMPELEPDEMAFIQGITRNMTEEQLKQFVVIYRSRRKEPMLILATTLVGFFGVAGIQRFLVGQIGMGVLYFFTAGLCFVGTIVDLVNYKRLAFEFNIKEAQMVQAMMGAYPPMR